MNRTGLLSVAVLLLGSGAAVHAQEIRPNILWITCEDISPNLGCYGDSYAVSPNIDRLASQGVRYTHAFAPIGVCAPSRSSLILGMYAPSAGSHHMRCSIRLAEMIRCFTEYLRMAGYFCSNNVKTDYNFPVPQAAWDESSAKAHWRNRRPGQPFFSVFNFTTCHESQIRLPEKTYQNRVASFTAKEKHDPAKAPIPPYHPNTPEVRQDWARYADMITYMDRQVGEILEQLEKDGLADTTIVFFFSDHGAGMPRSKRWLYDSSLRVPFIVRFPRMFEKLAPGQPGSTSDRLVSFVDFGPTVLSLAGVKVPAHMQGVPFLGPQAGTPREYIFGFRDRMDERYDMLRAVRDRRYKYIRNYLPHLPWFHHQYVSYMYEMPTMKVWQRLADNRKLTGATAVFMAPHKPPEELYDLDNDPHELKNLAALPESEPILRRMREAHRQWIRDVVDLGFLPEGDLRTRFGKVPEYEAVRKDASRYPLQRIVETADLASRLDPKTLPQLMDKLKDGDVAVRWWAATGLGSLSCVGSRPAADVKTSVAALQKVLDDPSAVVRVAAADSLCWLNQHDLALPVLIRAMQDDNEWVRLHAANVLDRIDGRARPALEVIQAAARDKNPYVVRVVEHTLKDLK
jgi:uncharacterized sulfatase